MNKHDMRHAMNLVAAQVATYVARLEGDAPTGAQREDVAFTIADHVLAEMGFPAAADVSEASATQLADEDLVVQLALDELDAQLDTRWR